MLRLPISYSQLRPHSMTKDWIPARVLAIGWLLAFGIFMPLFVVPPLEDVIRQQMAISHAQAALLYSLPVAMLALLAIPSGFLADTIGLKKSVGLGALIITVGSALRAISSEYSVVLTFTLLYGVGLALTFPNIPKLARNCSSRQRSHFTVGLLIAGILASGGLILAIARPVMYPLTGTFRGVFLLSTVPIFVALMLWWPLISDPPCEVAGGGGAKIDIRALKAIMTRKNLWLVSVFFWLHNFVLYTFVGWLPQYLAKIGVASNSSGLITSLTFWIGIPSIILLSWLSAKLGRRKPLLWGSSILLIVAMYAALLINATLSWVLVLFVGAANAIRFSTILSLPVEMVHPRQAGIASGMVMSVGYSGALVGPLIGGVILDSTGSYEWIFLSLVIVSAAATFLVFLIPETARATD
jgi:CP family cyanate transporter-like MFS transporter